MLNWLKDRLPRQGDWTPTIPFPLRAVILAVWAFEPISRGLDYITGDGPNVTRSLTKVEAAFPLPVWGIFCLIAGILIVFGFAGRWRQMSILGLHLAGATYFALGVGLAAAVIERGGDGFRTPVMFFVFAITYWSAAVGYAMNSRTRLVVVDDPDAKATDGSPAPGH